MKTEKIEYAACITYRITKNRGYDFIDRFNKIAKRFKGYEGGTGSDFNSRDGSYYFKTEKDRAKFTKFVRQHISKVRCHQEDI
jgi:hypothetical protein